VIRDALAVIVLLLAMSPFTAPFQTCDGRQRTDVAVASHDDDPGSIVAPLVPKAIHVVVAQAVRISWSPRSAWTAFLRARPAAIAFGASSSQSNVLRI
jgi:hypothetical protein